MSIKATTHPVNGVAVVNINGRITLGEGSSTLRETVHGPAQQRGKENPAEPDRCQLHRQLGDWRAGELLRHGYQPGWAAQTAESHQEGAGTVADH